MLTLKNMVFTPVYAAHCLRLPWHSFMGSIGITAIATVALTLAVWGTTYLHPLRGYLNLVLAGTAFGALWCGLAYTFFVTSSERMRLRQMVSSIIPAW